MAAGLLSNEAHGERRKEVMNTIGDRKPGREPPLFPDLLPSNTIPVSKSLRAPETTRLCRGRCDSNYIICPICYCFIHVRIICFGFLWNVWGFVCGPWETRDTAAALDRLFIKCPAFCQVDFPNHDAQIKHSFISAALSGGRRRQAWGGGNRLFTCTANWVRVTDSAEAVWWRIKRRQSSLLNTYCIMTASSLPQQPSHS